MSDTSLIFNLLGVDRVSDKLMGIKGAVALLGLGVAVASVKMAGDFEASTTRLVTSAGETHQNIDMVRKGMLEMAGQVGDSAMSLSQAMYTVESGGRHGAEGLMVLRAAAEGAKAEGADLTVVADALTSVLQDYHLKGTDAARVTSEMVAAVGAGKTTFEQFAGSLHSVLPIAQSAGISFEDVSAAIASMTVHGVSAEQATQNLADTIKHMIAPTGVQTKELAQLGISSSQLADMVGKRGLTGTLQDLSQLILSHMGPSGRVMLDAFNQSTDAAANANTMISKMPPNLQQLAHEFQHGQVTIGGWRASLKALPTDQANLLRQFAELQNQASGFSSVLKSGGPAAQTYQDALRRVTGDATGLTTALMLTGENTSYVNQTLKTISGATTEAGNHVKGWSDVQSTFNQKLAEFKASLGAVTIQLGNILLPIVKNVMNVIALSVGWFSKHTTVAATLAVVLGTLVVVEKAHATVLGVQAAGGLLKYIASMNIVTTMTKVWTAVQWLLNVAMDANPVGLVVIAVAALAAGIYYLWTHSAAFRNFFIGMWKDIWGFMKDVGHWFAGPFADFFVQLAKDVAAPFVWLWHNVIDPVWHGIYDTISSVASFVMRILTSTANLWLYIGNAVFQPIWRNVIKPVWNDLLLTSKLVWAGVAAGAMWLWHNILEPVGRGISIALHAVGAVVMWLWHNVYEPAFRGIATVGLWLWNNVLKPTFNGVVSAVHVVGGVFRTVFGAIGGFIAGAFHGAVGVVKQSLNDLFYLINKAIYFIDSHVIGVANSVPGVNFPMIPYVPYLAAGGDVTRGGIAIVGEHGPEPVYLPAGASVAPHSSLNSAMGRGDGTIHVTVKLDSAVLLQALAKPGRKRGGSIIVSAA